MANYYHYQIITPNLESAIIIIISSIIINLYTYEQFMEMHFISFVCYTGADDAAVAVQLNILLTG